MARILLVDDAAIVRHVAREMLTAAGHEIVGEAASGREAIAAYDEVEPDVAVIDVNMPDLDGFDATREIRLRDPDARIVIASVWIDPAKLVRANGLGAVEYVIKPFEARQLLAAVDAALAPAA